MTLWHILLKFMEFSYNITKDMLGLYMSVLTVYMLTRNALVSASYTTRI